MGLDALPFLNEVEIVAIGADNAAVEWDFPLQPGYSRRRVATSPDTFAACPWRRRPFALAAGRLFGDDPPERPAWEAVLGAERFVIPAGPPDLSFFLPSRVSAAGNYCCELPSDQDETVYVHAEPGVSLRYDPLRVYRVRGVFEAGHQVDAVHGVSLFRVRRARVEEAAGARIFKVGEPGPPAEPRPAR